MADKHYKLVNGTRFHLGFHRPSGAEVDIAPSRFVMLSMDEISYEAVAIKKWLESGALTCDDNELYEQFGITQENAVVAMTDAEIENKLKMSIKNIETWMDGMEDSLMLGRVYEAACRMDNLPIRKMELIEKKTGLSVTTGRKRMAGGEK